MADKVLLSGFRLRIGDENFNPPDAANSPYRLYFTDSSTDNAKVVYDGPDAGATSLGSIVYLDAQGYVPRSGVWLAEGKYNIVVEVRVVEDPLNGDVWDPLWTINKVPGIVEGAAGVTTGLINVVDTVAEIRALSGDDLGGAVINNSYYNYGDGGHGIWHWKSTSLKADDGGSFLIPNGQSAAVPGRWERHFDGNTANINQFGAVSGQSDVSGNIIRASQFCTRTSDNTGSTLEFPAGEYNIATANITLFNVGLTDGGREKPASFIVRQGCVFLGTGSIDFVNPTIFESTTYIHNNLTVSCDVDYVYPEWWGAEGDGVTNDDVPLKTCWEQSTGTIKLTGSYLFDGDASLAGGRDVHFTNGSSIILGTTGAISIDTVTNDSTTPIFLGEYGYQLYGNEYRLEWFEQVDYNIQDICNGATYGIFDLVWSGSTTMTYHIDDNSSVVHRFDGGAAIFLEDFSVRLNNAVMPNGKSIFFSTLTKTGTFEVKDTDELKAEWFGAHGALAQGSINHYVRSCIAYGWVADFKDIFTSTSGVITMATLSGSYLIVKNLSVTATDGTKNILDISGDGTVSLIGCNLSYSAITTTNYVINATSAGLKGRNVLTQNGMLNLGAGILDYKQCDVYQADIYLQSSASLKEFSNNTVINSRYIRCYASSSVLQNLTIHNNKFKSNRIPATAPGDPEVAFIELVPVGTNNTITELYITRNSYSNNGDRFPSPRSVIDGGDTVTNTWHPTSPLELVIKDEISFTLGLRGSLSYDAYEVLLRQTEGITYWEAASTITAGSFVPFNGFRFNSRNSWLTGQSCGASVVRSPSGTYISTRPVLCSSTNYSALQGSTGLLYYTQYLPLGDPRTDATGYNELFFNFKAEWPEAT